jgi:hypothetical protein
MTQTQADSDNDVAAHNLTATAFVGGPDSPFAGPRKQVPACANYPCPVGRMDDMALVHLGGPDKAVPSECAGAAAAAARSAPPTPMTSPKRAREDQEGGEDPDFGLGDPLARLTRQTMDLPRAARLVKSGSLAWIGDAVLFPSAANIESTGSPFDIWHDLCVFDQVLAVRFLAMVMVRNKPEDVRREFLPEDEQGDSQDATWAEVAGPTAIHYVFTPADCIEASLCRQVAAIGRKGRAHRTKRKIIAHNIGESEVQVRDAKGLDAWVDWLSFLSSEDAEVAVDRITRSVHEGPALITIAECKDKDPDFILGCFIIEMGLDREKSCRMAWRAIDAKEGADRRRLAKDNADDVKLYKTKMKERGAAAMAAGALRGGGGKGYANPVATGSGWNATAGGGGAGRGGYTPSTPGRGGGGRGGGRGGVGGGGGGPLAQAGGGGALAGGLRRTIGQVQAAPPANRSNTECRRFGLCLNCRDAADHHGAACTRAMVTYVP